MYSRFYLSAEKLIYKVKVLMPCGALMMFICIPFVNTIVVMILPPVVSVFVIWADAVYPKVAFAQTAVMDPTHLAARPWRRGHWCGYWMHGRRRRKMPYPARRGYSPIGRGYCWECVRLYRHGRERIALC
jgi:hypothetical protein